MTNPAPSKEEIAGLVERVTFHNEDNGFSVLQVKVPGKRGMVAVTGTLATATAGEWLIASGYWQHDRDHGVQFKAESIHCTPPTSLDGIEKYLGSGLIKGIGPVYARKLVEHFGRQVLDIIESNSARLETIDGIGPGRRRKIKEAWSAQKVVREIMLFLHSHGVSTSRAARIYKTYGDKAMEKVRSNPYLLARDIPGIGFKTADQIARQTGVPAESQIRCRAGVVHVLHEQSGQGHCAMPRVALTEQATAMLGVGTPLINEAINALLAQGELQFQTIAGQALIYLPRLLAAEQDIAPRIHRLSQLPSNYPQINISKALEWCEQKTCKSLAATQREAFAQALTRRLLVITGGPGVGKTTLLNFILHVLRAKKVKCLLCAPTGRAAKRLADATEMDAKTIHRLLEFQGVGNHFGRHAQRPLETDLLVVDEVSMVDVPLMQRLLAALPDNASLLLVGDVDQLPSVGPGSVLADVINSGVVPVARLTEVFRQAAASRIVLSAHRINQGLAPESPGKDEPSDFYFLERTSPEEILQTVVDLVRERLPRKFAPLKPQDIQVLSPMHRGLLGVRELNSSLQRELNPPRPNATSVQRFGCTFQTGDKVIQLVNNYDKDAFNGDIGVVTNIDPEEKLMTVHNEGRDVAYDFDELDELSLAYAITIHKSQGSEFPAVVIPLATQQYLLLQRNLLYTAVTRGRQLVVLVGQTKALRMALARTESRNRWGGLLERLRCANAENKTADRLEQSAG